MDLIQTAAIIIGMTTGIAGLVLGIINTIHQRSTVRPRLRVEPSIYQLIKRGIPGDPRNIEHNVGGMTIYNIGNVPVVGVAIGFRRKQTDAGDLCIITTSAINGAEWPAEILPGHSITLRMESDQLRKHFDEGTLGTAYVRTAVGDLFFASRKASRRFQEQLSSSISPASE